MRKVINDEIFHNRRYINSLRLVINGKYYISQTGGGNNYIDHLDSITNLIIKKPSKRNKDKARKIFNELLKLEIIDKSFFDQYKINF